MAAGWRPETTALQGDVTKVYASMGLCHLRPSHTLRRVPNLRLKSNPVKYQRSTTKPPASRGKEETTRRSTEETTSYTTKVGGAGVRVKNNRLQHIASQLLDSLSRQVGTPATAGAPLHLQSKVTEERIMNAFGVDAKVSLLEFMSLTLTLAEPYPRPQSEYQR